MSSARASLSRLDSVLSFLSSVTESAIPEAPATEAHTVTDMDCKKIADLLMSHFQDARRDMIMDFKMQIEGGGLKRELSAAALNIENVISEEVLALIPTIDAEHFSDEDKAKLSQVVGQLFTTVTPSPKAVSIMNAAYERVQNVCAEYMQQIEQEQHESTLQVIKLAVGDIGKVVTDKLDASVAYFKANGEDTGANESSTKPQDAAEGEDDYMQATLTLHSKEADIRNIAKVIKDTRELMSKKSAERHATKNGYEKSALVADEKTLKEQIDLDEDRQRILVAERNQYALELLGRAPPTFDPKARIDKSTVEKTATAALKRIKELKLGDCAGGTPPTGAATELKDALVRYASADPNKSWALAPAIARLREVGIGNWTLPSNKVLSMDEVTIDEDMSTNELHFMVTSYFAKFGFIASESQEKFEEHDENAQQAMAQNAKRAAAEFIKQNSAMFDNMKADLDSRGKGPVQDVVGGNGLFLGDRAENRRINAAVGDAMSVVEAWLLQTETFGVFATDDARDGIVYAAGNLVNEDWKKGVSQFQKQVDTAQRLKVSLGYFHTIHKYMLKLQQHRPSVAVQLDKKWGSLPEGMTREDNILGHIPTFIGDFHQCMQDATQKDRQMNKSQSFRRDRQRMQDRVNLFVHAEEESINEMDDDGDGEADEHADSGTRKGRRRNRRKPNNNKQGKDHGKVPSGMLTEDMIAVAQEQSRPRHKPGDRSNRDYANWKEREQHMATYKTNDQNTGKCCDIGAGCRWKGCNNARLTSQEYKRWKQFQQKKDDLYRVKLALGVATAAVGPYAWAICTKCKAKATESSGLTCRDGWVFKLTRRSEHVNATMAADTDSEHEDHPWPEPEVDGTESDEEPPQRPTRTPPRRNTSAKRARSRVDEAGHKQEQVNAAEQQLAELEQARDADNREMELLRRELALSKEESARRSIGNYGYPPPPSSRNGNNDLDLSGR